MPKPTIAFFNSCRNREGEAQQLAREYQFDYITNLDKAAEKYDYCLILTDAFLGLSKTTESGKPFFIDYLAKSILYRVQKASLKKELLARAIGFRPAEKPRIIDATAGLGRDSFLLASLGFEVIMLERSPVLHALLNDALKRAQQNAFTGNIVSRLRLIYTEASTWLKKHLPKEQPEVIYLDPMFPHKQKSALPKKDMVFLQTLLGKNEDQRDLFSSAFAAAKNRVIVKRPRKAAPLFNEPSFSIQGNSSRFDIYIKSALPNKP